MSSAYKKLDKDAYRILGTITVLGTLLGATIGFAAVERWDGAMIGAILSIPGSLLGGVLAIVFQWHAPQTRPGSLGAIPSFSITVFLTIAMVGLRFAIPSVLIRIVLLTVVAGILASAIRAYQKSKNAT